MKRDSGRMEGKSHQMGERSERKEGVKKRAEGEIEG